MEIRKNNKITIPFGRFAGGAFQPCGILGL